MNDRLTFLGDVYLDRPFDIDIELDNFIFNLEFPVSDRGIPVKNKVNLRQPRAFIKESFNKLPLAVSLANNHIFDYGEIAFEDTVSYLKEQGIPFMGAGSVHDHYNNPLSLVIAERKVNIYNYCGRETGVPENISSRYGIPFIDVDLITTDLQKSSGKDDLNICIFHWGEEEIGMPSPVEIKLAHKVIDAGADLIIGHHPHVIKPVELYRNKPIFYSLGNFAFPDLNLKTFWDGNKFTRKLKKKQHLSNRSSLIVEFNVKDHQYKVYKALQKGNYISAKEIRMPDQGPVLNAAEYPEYYARYYRTKRRKILLNAFLTNPRIPKPGSIKELFSSLIS